MACWLLHHQSSTVHFLIPEARALPQLGKTATFETGFGVVESTVPDNNCVAVFTDNFGCTTTGDCSYNEKCVAITDSLSVCVSNLYASVPNTECVNPNSGNAGFIFLPITCQYYSNPNVELTCENFDFSAPPNPIRSPCNGVCSNTFCSSDADCPSGQTCASAFQDVCIPANEYNTGSSTECATPDGGSCYLFFSNECGNIPLSCQSKGKEILTRQTEETLGAGDVFFFLQISVLQELQDETFV